MLPAAAVLVASAISAASKGYGDYKANKNAKKQAKYRSKEMERETHAGLLQDALSRSAELEGHRLSSRKKLGKRRAESLQDTADLMRGAFNL